jgi:hypothetical protein
LLKILSLQPHLLREIPSQRLSAMVTLKGHKRCDHQDPEDPDLRCYRQPSFNFFGSVGGIFCHQHKVGFVVGARAAFKRARASRDPFADARHGECSKQVLRTRGLRQTAQL